jgi:hypothetical protein
MAYMDNMIIMAPDKAHTIEHEATALEVITSLGWHINHKKSALVLSQSKEFLGLTINMTREPHFWVPMGKAHTLKHNIKYLLHTHNQDGQVPV